MPPDEESRRRRLQFGTWNPPNHSVALAVIQLVTAAQAGLRGIDYLKNRDALGAISSPGVRAVEEIGDLRLWGAIFLFGAIVQIVSLSGGWILGIFTGHAILFGVYTVLGFILLSGVVQTEFWPAVIGSLLLGSGLYLALVRWTCRNCWRFIASLALTGFGLWITGSGLGIDFRSATGVLSAGVVQITLLLGMAVYVYGDRAHKAAE